MNFLKHLFARKQLFSDISGHEDINWILEQVVNNGHPVHILLVGSPGLGKTRFLKAIEKQYPELSYFALASGSTGAGMINECFNSPPRFLLIDELEDLLQSDQATLFVFGEFGPLIRAANGENVPVNELKSELIKAIEIIVRLLPFDSTVKRP